MCDFIGNSCKRCVLEGKEYEKNVLKSVIFVINEEQKKIIYPRSPLPLFQLSRILNHLQNNKEEGECELIKILKIILGLESPRYSSYIVIVQNEI